MRVHAVEAVLEMPADADLAAPGAAVTVELCGSWEHPGPCPVAAHRTSARRRGAARVVVRTLFVAGDETAGDVRTRIGRALATECLDVAGRRARWRVVSYGASTLRRRERAQATRLLGA